MARPSHASPSDFYPKILSVHQPDVEVRAAPEPALGGLLISTLILSSPGSCSEPLAAALQVFSRSPSQGSGFSHLQKGFPMPWDPDLHIFKTGHQVAWQHMQTGLAHVLSCSPPEANAASWREAEALAAAFPITHLARPALWEHQ